MAVESTRNQCKPGIFFVVNLCSGEDSPYPQGTALFFLVKLALHCCLSKICWSSSTSLIFTPALLNLSPLQPLEPIMHVEKGCSDLGKVFHLLPWPPMATNSASCAGPPGPGSLQHPSAQELRVQCAIRGFADLFSPQHLPQQKALYLGWLIEVVAPLHWLHF